MSNVNVIKSENISCPHGFSTRVNGVSEGVFNSLNLGMNRGDDENKVTKNWDLFLEACGIKEKSFVCGAQVHGNRVAIVNENDCRPCYGKYSLEYVDSRKAAGEIFSVDNLLEADGYVTNVPNVPIAIFTADCTPLLMEDPVNKVIAAVHCGWRSTALDIMNNAVTAMVSLGANVKEIRAAIGPAICKDCFEVGEEVVDAMKSLLNISLEEMHLLYQINPNNNEKYLLDLKSVVKTRLIQIGLLESHINDTKECTMCNPSLYWSHRITGFNRGSQANVIMLPPENKTKILLVAINAKFIHSNPAIHMLKNSVKNYSENVEIAEYAINQLASDILSDIYKKKPDVIAFSCYIWNAEILSKILVDIPSVLPNAHIWLGGPEVSYDAPKVIKQYPFITGVMCGEGEEIFSELVTAYCENRENYENHNNFENISGLYINNPNFPEPVFTGVRPLTDIDNIPFIYNDLSMFDNKIIYYESSRGCPFRCSYCLSSIDKSVRLRSLDKVLPELQFFLDNKVPQVKFIDRTFNCNKEHALKIWTYLLEHDNGITNFHFEVAADLISKEELDIIKQMRPGLIQLEIGVQSTNPVTIKEIRRTMNLDKLKAMVDEVHSYNNTHQHLDLIAGLPYEDLTSFIKSFNDVYAMRPDQLQLGFLKVLKGSYMEEMKDEYGIKYQAHPPYEVHSTKWISYDEILLLKGIEEMVELYYNTGQFTNTISFLEKSFDTPFEMYQALSNDYIENGYDIRKPARSYRYEMLYNFVKKHDPNNEEIYKELLTMDIYLRENCKVRPTFAKDLKYYKEEIRNITESSNNCTKDKRNHIEIFSHINSGNMDNPAFYEFDYSNRNPLNNNAKMIKL